ncbi:MAG: MopE-related protein [Pseudomonadota bacterium]
MYSRVAPLVGLTLLLGCGQPAYEIPDGSGGRSDAAPRDLNSGSDAENLDAGPLADSAGTPDAAPGQDSVPAGCDDDRDTFLDTSCGGLDCDDDDPAVHPGADELCSFVDENCINGNNEGLDCTFVAAGGTNGATLYKIDPFAGTASHWVDVTLANPNRGILDIDIDINNRLLAVTGEGLYTVSSAGQMTLLTQVATPERTNGMAIDSSNTIFLTNSPTTSGVQATAQTVDSLTGQLTLLGNLSPYVSSGDCVTLKDDSLLMTAPDPDVAYNPQDPEARKDLLVYVDSRSAATRLLGTTGFAKVYGLSASFGFLFGVTDFGKVLQVNAETGQGTLLFEVQGERFWGAANGD